MAACLPIPVWAGMTTNNTATVYGTALRYWCAANYEFADQESDKMVECSAEGTWQPAVVDCIGE